MQRQAIAPDVVIYGAATCACERASSIRRSYMFCCSCGAMSSCRMWPPTVLPAARRFRTSVSQASHPRLVQALLGCRPLLLERRQPQHLQLVRASLGCRPLLLERWQPRTDPGTQLIVPRRPLPRATPGCRTRRPWLVQVLLGRRPLLLERRQPQHLQLVRASLGCRSLLLERWQPRTDPGTQLIVPLPPRVPCRCSAMPSRRTWSPTVLPSARAKEPAAPADLTSLAADAAPCPRAGCGHL